MLVLFLYPVCIMANEANQSTNIDTDRKQLLFHDGGERVDNWN